MGNARTSAVAVTAATVFAVAAATGCSGGNGTTSSSAASSASTASSGAPSAVPPPVDYTGLLIKASDVGPSYTVQGAPTHNSGADRADARVFFIDPPAFRAVADVVTVFPDPATAAQETASTAFGSLSKDVPGVPDQPIDVGTNGRMIVGVSPNGKATTALVFTEGKAEVYLRFRSAASDPIPPEVVLDIARKQDAAIKNGLPG